jgi:mRNA capping enzyme, beta chain
MKDITYSDGSRATHLCVNVNEDKYEDQPYVVIKKTRLEDNNIKAGVGLPDCSTFKSDVRVSYSTEVPFDPNSANNQRQVKSTRIKERTSF